MRYGQGNIINPTPPAPTKNTLAAQFFKARLGPDITKDEFVNKLLQVLKDEAQALAVLTLQPEYERIHPCVSLTTEVPHKNPGLDGAGAITGYVRLHQFRSNFARGGEREEGPELRISFKVFSPDDFSLGFVSRNGSWENPFAQAKDFEKTEEFRTFCQALADSVFEAQRAFYLSPKGHPLSWSGAY